MHGPPQVTLPRPIREKSPDSPRYSRYSESTKPSTRDIAKYLEKPISKYLEKQKSLEREYNRYPEERYQDDYDRKYKEKPMKYFDDDGFDENIKYRNRHYDDPPIPKTRQNVPPSDNKYYYQPRPKSAQQRQRSPSPDDNTSPRDRFKDAKEKFLSMEKERLSQEPPISPVTKERFLKRHESMMYESRPKPRPDDRYLNRYRDKYDPKRRSMFNLIEEEHRKNSNEIARELKRRSYMDDESYTFSKSSVELDQVGEMKYSKNQKNSAGYRHSYAEPKLRMEAKGGKKHFDALHRTNSVTNNGRVGIASVHPY